MLAYLTLVERSRHCSRKPYDLEPKQNFTKQFLVLELAFQLMHYSLLYVTVSQIFNGAVYLKTFVSP